MQRTLLILMRILRLQGLICHYLQFTVHVCLFTTSLLIKTVNSLLLRYDILADQQRCRKM